MRQSELFTKTTRESPKDETSFNAEILIKGGAVLLTRSRPEFILFCLWGIAFMKK